ncbi:MAG: hypothetical protein E3J87_04235 [Candidatus Cloacimonadota bacterium]|nr:MAG: hypothetical protein E3J87_04235 [Candidatus Cloacimonadota bacterium]
MKKIKKVLSNVIKTVSVLSFLLTTFFLNAQELYKPPQKEKIGKRLQGSIKQMKEKDEINIWVFFTDKGIFSKDEYEKSITRFKNRLSPRRRKRRERTGRAQIADFTDLPVNRDYVKKVIETGAKKRIISNWLNGASFRVTKKELEEIKIFPFVYKIKKVQRFHLKPEPYKPRKKIIKKMDKEEGYEFNYGNSKTQNSLISINIAHNNGYFGEGVRIGLFDTGFWVDSIRFEAFGVVSKRIIDKWDFINSDSNVGPELGDPAGQINHGTSMLSLIAGFKDNELIGPAFNAEFALAKTEIIDEEIHAEEDFWAAAAEWVDSCGPDNGGVDIISSSLGYRQFPDDTFDYTYEDMNGDSTIITKAADMAVSKGIIVVTAMGNINYNNPTDKPDTCMVAPADGDSVISAGAVDTNYTTGKWEWAWIPESGTGAIIGPTYDGRRKPEVCATWSGYHTNPEYDYTAPDTADQFPYVTGQGTSVSTAMIAGGCALILQAHPDWSPMKVREVLMNTASLHNSPNDTLGWGIANIWKAIKYEDPFIPPFENDELSPFYPNPFVLKKHSYVVLPFNIMNQGTGGKIFIYSLSGRKIKEIELGSYLLPGRYSSPEYGAATWNGKDSNGKMVDAGIYIVLLRTGWTSSIKKLAVIR